MAAERMGVCEATISNWERGLEPADTSYPAIISFLGAEPWPTPVTLADRSKAERRRRGLTIAEAAALLGADPTTYWWWETGRKPHRLEHRRRLADFLEDAVVGQAPPQPDEPPSPIKSVGAMLRARRQELGLSLDAAAPLIGVSGWTLMGWELGRRKPTDRFYPQIIRFLDREPWPEPQTGAERLRAKRLRLGLSREQAAAVMQVDPGSLAKWEGGAEPHHALSRAKIDAFITGGPRPWGKAAKGHKRPLAGKP